MSSATGGEAYFAKSWKDEQRAFAAIRDELAHLYALNYYPQSNPNRGWRTITVKLVGYEETPRPVAKRLSSPTGPVLREYHFSPLE